MKFNTRFDPPPKVSIGFPTDHESSQSKVRSEFASECDINEIIRRFRVTGLLSDPSKPLVRKPMFGDFSEVPDESERERIFIAAENAWSSLSEKQRDLFPGGPSEILDALSDPKRKGDLEAAGFLAPITSKAAEAATPEPPREAATSKPPQVDSD